MANLAADVRDSTLRSLKLTCPSAEVVDYEILSDSATDSVHTGTYPPIDGDGECSDEEQLIPHRKRKAQYRPRYIEATIASAETSSEESNYTLPSHIQMSKNASLLVSPKSPPSAEAGVTSDQDDLLRRFYHVSKERDVLQKALQKRRLASPSIPGKVSIAYRSEEKTLVEEVHALRSGIQIWVEEYFGGPISNRTKRPHLRRTKKLFGDLTEDPKAYLENREDRPLLIQSYVWSKLQQKIFSNWRQGCGYVWAGKLGEQLQPINDTLRNAVKDEAQAEEYHHWRANTVNLLVPQVDGKWRPTFDAAPVLKRISHLCSRLRSKLRPWSTRSLHAGKEQLRTIVSASVALDLKMKRQRADYRFVTFTKEKDHCWGYDFFESEMEDIYEEDDQSGKGGFGHGSFEGGRVVLALAPALERCGNAKGYVYDQTSILVKADVSCKRLERSKNFSNWRDGGKGSGRRWKKYTKRDEMVKRALR